MKKLIACILAILYMGSSTGATVHLHYCMGELVEQGLWHGNANKCGNCAAKKDSSCKKNCCKDEQKFVKLEKDQKAGESAFQFQGLISLVTPVNFTELPQVQITSITQELPANNAPPRSCSVQPHILYCIFRI